MRVDDEETAKFYLQHLNYYRLGAYWLPFEKSHNPHEFRPGTQFEDALNLYVFDRSLRLLVLDAIERIEVSVRSQWAYHLSHQYGPHAHLDTCSGYGFSSGLEQAINLAIGFLRFARACSDVAFQCCDLCGIGRCSG